jgi:GDP-L-fucose synthase
MTFWVNEKVERMKIVVTGSSGFLGRNLIPFLGESGHEVIGLNSQSGDLTDLRTFSKLLNQHKPNLIIHLAGLVGGIQANRTSPASFFYINQSMTANLFEAARNLDAKIFITIGGCSYPGSAISPITEEQMWDGYPQIDSAPFSVAKKTAITAAEAYRYQYGIDTKVIIPGNMYGPHDNFRSSESHVVPALIRKFHEAKVSNAKSIPIWGSGRATRDFVYVGDVARIISELVNFQDLPNLMNISSGDEVSIRSLAVLLQKTIAPEIDLEFDSSAPEGQLHKIFSTKKMQQLGLQTAVSLEEGLRKTYGWLTSEITSQSRSLRW